MACAYGKDVVGVDGAEGVCQFNQRKDRLISCNDKTWCKFHLPENADVSLDDLASALDRSFNNYLFENIREAHARRAVADMSGVVFRKSFALSQVSKELGALPALIFNGCIFVGDTNFSQCNFANGVQFNKCTFKNTANFSGAKFCGYAEFSGSNFVERAIFSDVVFDGKGMFGSVKFHAVCNFSNSTFRDAVNFNKVEFCEDACFRGMTTFLNARTTFREASFCRKAEFSHAKFGGYISFRVRTHNQ